MRRRMSQSLIVRRTRIWTIIIACIIGITTLGATHAQKVEDPLTLDESLAKDAEWYADQHGVDQEEALRRLELQSEIGSLNAKLMEQEREIFAGLWVEHDPEFRIIVRFTSNGDETIQNYIEQEDVAEILDVREASVTLEQLTSAQEKAMLTLEEANIPFESGLNLFESRVEIYVTDQAQVESRIDAISVELPPEVDIIEIEALSEETADIYGGLHLSQCTSGFAVQNNSGTRGITTAGHCPDTLSYNGNTLPWVDGTGGGVVDIQWHTAPGLTVRNLIFDGGGQRPINYLNFRATTFVGATVCKYGKTTGFGCGTVLDTEYNGSNIRVDIPGAPGDSGGPWFLGNTAYGTSISMLPASGHTIYGPIDQIYDRLNVFVLTN